MMCLRSPRLAELTKLSPRLAELTKPVVQVLLGQKLHSPSCKAVCRPNPSQTEISSTKSSIFTRSAMRLYFPLLVCLAVALSTAAISSPLNLWTKLILTQQWPNTFCSVEHHCHPNFSYWTLHGLWPDKGNNCNSSWHFNSSEIEDLLPDMKKSWPDLLNPSSVQFWKYEWSKHGTCAAEAASLNSQHKYFSKALELYHKVDLNSMLMKFNITPSDKYYTFSEIEEGMTNFYGVKPKIQCVHPSKNSEPQVLGQIEICFDADFSLLDCEKHFTISTFSRGPLDHPLGVTKPSGLSVCSYDIPVYYPPIP